MKKPIPLWKRLTGKWNNAKEMFEVYYRGELVASRQMGDTKRNRLEYVHKGDGNRDILMRNSVDKYLESRIASISKGEGA